MTILQPNSWLFQMANVCLFFSYISTDILILRIVLAIAALFFLLWGAIDLDVALDTCLWNGIFMLINTAFAIQIMYTRRPVRFARPEHEDLYTVCPLSCTPLTL